MQPGLFELFKPPVVTLGIFAGSRATALAQPHVNGANQLITDLLSNPFTRVNAVALLAEGDIISIKYPDGADSSGHVMLVQSVGPWRHRSQSAQKFLYNNAEPDITGFYDIIVIDSSASYHGPADTRANNPGGIGRNGVFRIYVSSTFQVLGYTWSTVNASEYKKVEDGYLVSMGRLNTAAW